MYQVRRFVNIDQRRQFGPTKARTQKLIADRGHDAGRAPRNRSKDLIDRGKRFAPKSGKRKAAVGGRHEDAVGAGGKRDVGLVQNAGIERRTIGSQKQRSRRKLKRRGQRRSHPLTQIAGSLRATCRACTRGCGLKRRVSRIGRAMQLNRSQSRICGDLQRMLEHAERQSRGSRRSERRNQPRFHCARNRRLGKDYDCRRAHG
jgi:hypothetical protein